MDDDHTIADACSLIRDAFEPTPELAIILGSGLGGIADKITNSVSISFSRIPGFATSTAKGHRGELILGELEGRHVVAMAGRYHRYEGWSVEQVSYPVSVLYALGANKLIVSNAAGGVNPNLCVGDIVIIRDHINWLGTKANIDHCEVSTLQRSKVVYDDQLCRIARDTSVANGFTAVEGTYLATIGPNYETRAEYRMMRRLGVDVVGMSTVPEMMEAARVGLRTLGLSMVSNVASPDAPVEADHAEVLEAGQAAGSKMEAIVRSVLNAD